MCLKCTNEKCLTKANKWMNSNDKFLPNHLYDKYSDGWIHMMNEAERIYFYLLIAHSEYDK